MATSPPSVSDVPSDGKPSAAATTAPSSHTAELADGDTTQPRHPREGMAAWKWPCILVLFALSMILIGYDVSNIANIQPPIYQAFGHVELLPWVAVGYSSLSAAVVLLLGRLSRFVPLKPLFLSYQVFVFLGAVVAGTATNMNAVIVGRAINGIGCGGLYSGGTLLNLLLSTPAEFPRVQGLCGICWAIGLILGPVVGGAFAESEHATWRWAIYINLPIVSGIFLLSILCIPSINLEPGAPILARLATTDWAGATLHFAFTVLLCAALIFSGSTWRWDSGSAIAAWAVVGVLLVAYVAQQAVPLLTTPSRRLFPVALVRRSRAVALIVLATGTAGGAYGITLYYTPLLFAFTRGFAPLDAAVRLLPYICTFITSVMLSTGLLPVVRRYAPFFVAGGVCIMAGAGALTAITPDTAVSYIMGLDALVGFGIGLMWQIGVAAMTRLAQNSSERHDATALFVTAQLGGISTALALAGCVFQNVGFRKLSDAIGPLGLFTDQDLREALAGVDSRVWTMATTSAADAEVVPLAVAAVTAAIARLNWLVFAAGAVAFTCGLLMPFHTLDFGPDAEAKAVTDAEGVDPAVEKSTATGDRP